MPSLLLCDFGHLAHEVRQLEEAGARSFHLDVMDGHFVPNITYGMPIVEAVRRETKLPIETHLMISNPEKYVEQFVESGADAVTFHVEASDDPRPILKRCARWGRLPDWQSTPTRLSRRLSRSSTTATWCS